jgi:hypothetical protein
MNIDLTGTTSGEINAALLDARRRAGNPATGAVLTLVIVTDEQGHYDACGPRPRRARAPLPHARRRVEARPGAPA